MVTINILYSLYKLGILVLVNLYLSSILNF